MPVSGLVVSVADEGVAPFVMELIALDRSFTIGECGGTRFVVAVAAPDAPAAERQHEWLRQLPGVVKVDVAFVYLGAAEEGAHVR